jgi:tetraacyldisaccharide 4'-kinase
MASWYGGVQWTRLLWPVMWLFAFIVKGKRQAFIESEKVKTPKPVVVVGNITVGGTGKTPLVQALVAQLQRQGLRPGIISRGYGSTVTTFPYLITQSDSSILVGDEPFMLFHSLNVPVVIDPKRKQALDFISQMDVDVILSDDGMQHYGLPRDIEICVLDGARGTGNGCLLPVGPLREPVARLKAVDFVLYSGKSGRAEYFDFKPMAWVNVKSGKALPLNALSIQENAIAIAGIGNPQKFATTLSLININCPLKPFSDHYAYKKDDFKAMHGQILMTEKDAVKIMPFAHENMWYLQIQAQLHPAFVEQFTKKLTACLELKNG